MHENTDTAGHMFTKEAPTEEEEVYDSVNTVNLVIMAVSHIVRLYLPQ